MALGIPGDIVTAIMLGALLIHDITPSPKFIVEQPVLAYSLFIAFFLANFIVLALQSVTLRLFVLITKVAMYILAGVILVYCGIGVFALSNSTSDMWTLLIFGLLGYVMRELGFPLAPMILGVILGPIAERWLARATTLSTDPILFLTHPWSLFFVMLTVFSLLFPLYQRDAGKRLWVRYYTPALFAALAVPLALMGGYVRPVFGAVLLIAAIFVLVRPSAVALPELRE
jgi:putative tricarboxylic transport membrane protein